MEWLKLDKVSVYFAQNTENAIFKEISFSVPQGKILALLGPNGSGKSSLLRAISGFIPHEVDYGKGLNPFRFRASLGEEQRRMKGKVYLGGKDITRLNPSDRRIALVPQNLALYPDKSVLKNLASPLIARGKARQEAYNNAKKVAKWLNLSDIINRRPDEISGGQQQRVAIGRALIGEPRLLLLDEPFSNIDFLSKQEVLTFITKVLREKKTSAVFVTHDPEEAMYLSDIVAFIQDHHLHQVASAQEAYENPSTLFVAKMFSGFKNFIFGNLDVKGEFALEGCDGNINIGVFFKPNRSINSEKVWLAAKLSALSTSKKSSGGIKGVVESFHRCEGSLFADIRLANSTYISLPTHDDVAIGSTVFVSIGTKVEREDLRLFDYRGLAIPFV